VDLTGIEAAHLRKRVEITPPPGVTHAHADPTEVEVIITPRLIAMQSSSSNKKIFGTDGRPRHGQH